MRLLIVCFLTFWISLTSTRHARSRKPYQPVTTPAPLINKETQCCDCLFEDTDYTETACNGHSSFMKLIQQVMSARCDISDPCRRLGKDELPNQEEWYDFIIVGAGVAGPVIARRLSDNGAWKVLLIEAGPEEPSMTSIPGLAFNAINSSVDWKFLTEPTAPHPTACLGSGGVCSWPRGKMVSGTAGMYGMMYVRGHPEVYNKWARDGNPGWAYDEIKHYFELIENGENAMNIEKFTSKPQFAEDLLNAAEYLGHRTSNFDEYNQSGFMIAPMMTSNGARLTTSRAYLRPIVGRKNLHVLTNAQVTRVLINSWNNMAYGVELVDKRGEKRMIKCNKEVILSAGAIGSPHILLNSGIGPKASLTKLGINVIKDLPVGYSLHNHVSIGIHMSVNDKPYETMTMSAVNEYLERRTGPLASTGLTQTTAFIESSFATKNVPDIQVFFDGFSSKCPKTGLPIECPTGNIGTCFGRREIVARPTVLYTETRGYLTLRSNNPLDAPLIYPNYFADPKDIKILIEGIKHVVRLIETPPMKQWDLRLELPIRDSPCTTYHFGTDAYWECWIRWGTGPENHQSGSCKMGPRQDPYAVVDSNLRVHGIENMRVADASIFPIVPNSNPVAAIIMVAEKLSDMICSSWCQT